MNDSIYYHFLNRELRKSVNATVSDDELLRVCCLSLYMTDNILYLPISNLYESKAEFPKTAEFINKMDKAGLIYPVSSHETREGFILSRQEYYSSDRKRYPMYFEEIDDIWSPNIICPDGSTTVQLEHKLRNDKIDIKELNRKSRDEIKKFVEKVFENRKKKAVTMALFREKAKASYKLSDAEMNLALEYIKCKISLDYTQRYLDIENGTIITGITGIKKYDFLAKDLLDTYFPAYQIMFRKCGVDIKCVEGRKLLFDIKLDYPLYRYIYIKVKEIISLLSTNIDYAPTHLSQEIKKSLEITKNYPKANTGMAFFKNLDHYLNDICTYNNFSKDGIDRGDGESIVLVAVTSTEMKVLIGKVREYFPDSMLIEKIGKKIVYRELINERRKVYLVQSEMGNVGVGAIVNTTHLICEELNPKYIIMGGIAFGCDAGKQHIGEVLVSKQVWYYERAKLTEGNTIDRGDKIPSSAWLLRLFRSSELEYEKNNIHFGLIASGEKLINSPEMIEDLKRREPELIGGDMEASGLVSVCEEKKIEWIFAKGICDWGINKDNSKQVMAAENAFDFIMHNLRKLI